MVSLKLCFQKLTFFSSRIWTRNPWVADLPVSRSTHWPIKPSGDSHHICVSVGCEKPKCLSQSIHISFSTTKQTLINITRYLELSLHLLVVLSAAFVVWLWLLKEVLSMRQLKTEYHRQLCLLYDLYLLFLQIRSWKKNCEAFSLG